MSTWRTRRLEELERNGILEYQEILEGLGRNVNLENQEVRRVGKEWYPGEQGEYQKCA